MKKLIRNLRVILLVTIVFSFSGAVKQAAIKDNYITIYPTEDTTSLIRNPAMGWGLYDDAGGNVANAENYWAVQDEAAKKYASYFYVRWRWSDMEPEEGKYAWLYNDNFKKLIKGALDRDLKLAFRIYVNGQDNIKTGTPLYVKDAGAKGYFNNGRNGNKNWTPYPDDSVFQEKFSKFIQAFAKEFDDPSRVDFVDGNGLGQWGEGDNIKTIHNDQLSVFKWVINLYAKNFKKILLVTNLGSQEGLNAEKEIAFDGNDFLPRRDGLGSHWYREDQKKMMASLFPGKPLIGEACYWQSDSVLFKNDPAFKNYAHPVTWNDVYNLTYNDAISSHANTLDLREPEQTKRWIDKAPVLVKEFMINGGYRFYPYKLSFPKRIKSDSNFDIVHEWKNTGAGMCPSNNKRWNYKYKVAFALIQKSNMQVKELFIDEKTDPSQWIKGLDYKYLFKGKLDTKIKAGDYILGLAIIDTTNKKPGIQLAIKDLTKLKNGWTEIETIQVSK
jgi:NOL1/NOP2/fmu family ribosome biogenesis protein